MIKMIHRNILFLNILLIGRSINCEDSVNIHVQYSLLLTSPSKSNSVLVIRSGCTKSDYAKIEAIASFVRSFS